MPTLQVYADESCKSGQRYLAIGGIAVEKDKLPEILKAFADARDPRGFSSEVKWTSIRRSKLPFYIEYVDIFFQFAIEDHLHFHALYTDTSTADHEAHSDGSDDIGYDKLLFQLLLHKFGRRYGSDYEIHVYLDRRRSVQPPEVIRPMLNNKLSSQYGITTNPFKLIRFVDSKDCELIQVCDLFVGALASRRNKHHRLAGASVYKRALGDHIAISARDLEAPYSLFGSSVHRFTIWPFRYRQKGESLRA